MARGSVQRLKHLQREAFQWALIQGFNVVAFDVSLPQIAVRVDVAAFRMDPPRRVRGEAVVKPGPTVVFECKVDRTDFLRDTQSEESLRERLRELNQQREAAEERMRREFPTLREGLTLFPEFDAYRFREAGGSEYCGWLAEIEELSRRLYSKGRFSRMLRWRGANLCYVVAERGVARRDELPVNWGLMELGEGGLEIVLKAVWQEASDLNRWNLGCRIAARATSELGERYGAVERRRRRSPSEPGGDVGEEGTMVGL
jgi:hypothetical protein